MESDLECPLCHSEYSGDNMPRLLTACGHTYCQSCLDTLFIEDQDQYRLQCPEDSIVVYLKTNDITQFPKNIALIKLIEGKKHSNSSSVKDQSLEITNIQKNQDSHGNESEQQIINEIVSSEKPQSRQEEKLRKDSSTHSQDPEPNVQLIKAKPSPKIEEELCLVHQKPLEIVCVVDMEKICSKCAIFGQHKGHEFKSIDQIEEECKNFHQDIFNVYNEKEDIVKQWDEINSREVLQILEVNRRKIVNEVGDKYKRLRDAVARSEEVMLAKIDETCTGLQQKIRGTLKIDEAIMNEYAKFENQSFGVVIKSQEPGLYEEKLRMLYDNTTASLLFRGKEIVARIKTQHNNIFTEIEKIINSIKMEYSEDDVFKALKKFSEIKVQNHAEEKIEHPGGKQHDESLLESEVQEHENVYLNNNLGSSMGGFANNPTNPPPVQSYSVTFSDSKTFVPKSEAKVEIKPDLSQKMRDSPAVFVEEQHSQKIERPPKKKLKSIKVPEKVEKILESLYNDTLDTLDLTNAELGDGAILQICEFLRGTRVRTVKFIRNKLSDDAVSKMINCFGGVVTLNLSQNFLTEQSLNHLANQRNAMPSLKTVILSQNRIIERKHKEFIDRLKRTDVNVST